MNENMPFDCAGQDGKDNKEAFYRLPVPLQLIIRQTQSKIHQAVVESNPARKIKSTSGFRSHKVSSRWGGVADSLHHYGFARDYKFFPDEPEPLKVPEFLVCLKSGTEKNPVWHVQYKRGV